MCAPQVDDFNCSLIPKSEFRPGIFRNFPMKFFCKVSDRGGGFDKKTARRVWDYGFTTANKDLLLANNDPFKNTSLAEPDPEVRLTNKLIFCPDPVIAT